MRFNPITQDPLQIDTEYPADMIGVDILSHGARMLGVLYKAQGVEPHPTAILLHGIPGNERNFDLAQILRRAGWHVLIFHYRGSWGSDGDYSFTHVLEDSLVAVRMLRDIQFSAQHRIDSERIAVLGHSMGGWAALMLAAQGHIQRAASLAGVNFGMWGELMVDEPGSRPESLKFFESVQAPLKGTSGQELVEELMAHAEDWNLLRYIEPLSQKHLLLVAGERDQGVPPKLHHTPLVEGLQKAGAKSLSHAILDAEHSFADRRIELAELILNWLKSTVN